MRTPERALARKRRYRRRLRSRIILSFVIFGFVLTALIATTAVYLRNRVEDQVISAALVKNNTVFAEGFSSNPNAIGEPFEKTKGRHFSNSMFARVPDTWRATYNGLLSEERCLGTRL